MPTLLEEAVRSKTPELLKLIQNGAKEWQDKYAIECEKRRKLHNLVQELKGNIRVHCRVRPLFAHEKGSCISFPGTGEIQIRDEEKNQKKTWEFNEVFQENATQEMVFTAVRDLVVSVIDGYNVCIFAYGQTGSGKTHSMQGYKGEPGIYQRTFAELFKVAKDRKGWAIDFKVALTEIYNDEIRDLLVPDGKKKEKLQVKMGKEGNHVPGLTMQAASGPANVEAILEMGAKNRTTACTDMNEHSSRSHLLLQIYCSMATPEGKSMSSVITLVDLAGSERMAKSGVTGDRAKEAIAINKSLSALGDVINARASKSSHTPFRNSTLTHMLQDSLSGDSKTLMLLQINPCQEHVEESMCPLVFGARVNNVEMNVKK
jgi:kinesin family protein C2/C3